MAPKKKQPWAGFRFHTADVAAICDLMYGLRDLTKVVRFRIKKDGVYMGDSACQENLFLHAHFPADHFTSFVCEGEGDHPICFYAEHMHTMLKSHQQRDEMFWEYDAGEPRWLCVRRLMQGQESSELSFRVPLLKIDEDDEYESPKMEVNYMLAFTPVDVSMMLTCFNSIEKEFFGDWVTLSCDDTRFEISMENGATMRHARFTFLTKKDEEAAKPRKVARRDVISSTNVLGDGDFAFKETGERITKQYRLRYLHQMLKCFAITRGLVLVYIVEDYPITFEIKIGSLGRLKATLMFHTPSADDDEPGERAMDGVLETNLLVPS